MAEEDRTHLRRLFDRPLDRFRRRRPLRRARGRDPRIKGPRSYDPAGIPLAFDNKSIFKERFYSDKADPNILYDEITTIDSALTRPWSVTKTYARLPIKQPMWVEEVCAEGNSDVEIGKEPYFLSGDGYLMPTKKGQPAPDLRYFKKTQ